jgi:threonine aldolase
VVAGTRDFIAKARRLRRRLGGGMRQAGVLAAAALYALENNVERLADDHRNAKRLAEALAGMRDLFVNPLEVDTNMVFATVQPGDGGLTPDAPGVIAARLREAGVLCGAEGMRVRFVTHLDVSAADVDEAVVRVRRVLA